MNLVPVQYQNHQNHQNQTPDDASEDEPVTGAALGGPKSGWHVEFKK